MSKASELEEIENIYQIIVNECTTMNKAKAIYNAGYTKSPFDVEELKAWLEKKMKSLNAPCSTIANTEYLAFQEVLDKIRKIEEKLAKEGR